VALKFGESEGGILLRLRRVPVTLLLFGKPRREGGIRGAALRRAETAIIEAVEDLFLVSGCVTGSTVAVPLHDGDGGCIIGSFD
jgi:hypothetical protein